MQLLADELLMSADPFRLLPAPDGQFYAVNGEAFGPVSAEQAQRYVEDMNAVGGSARYAEKMFARYPELRGRIERAGGVLDPS